MMEYIKVLFSTTRTVYVDGVDNGQTNVILRVGPGAHIISLGQPENYQPLEQMVEVIDTSALAPMVLDFTEQGEESP